MPPTLVAPLPSDFGPEASTRWSVDDAFVRKAQEAARSHVVWGRLPSFVARACSLEAALASLASPGLAGGRAWAELCVRDGSGLSGESEDKSSSSGGSSLLPSSAGSGSHVLRLSRRQIIPAGFVRVATSSTSADRLEEEADSCGKEEELVVLRLQAVDLQTVRIRLALQDDEIIALGQARHVVAEELHQVLDTLRRQEGELAELRAARDYEELFRRAATEELEQLRRCLGLGEAAPWPQPPRPRADELARPRPSEPPAAAEVPSPFACAAAEAQAGPASGSAAHAAGTCRPCFYISSRAGCHSGSTCIFCHADHGKKKKERPPKSVRQECKAIARDIFQGHREATLAEQDEAEQQLLMHPEMAHVSIVTSQYACAVLRALYRQEDTGECDSNDAASIGPEGAQRPPSPGTDMAFPVFPRGPRGSGYGGPTWF